MSAVEEKPAIAVRPVEERYRPIQFETADGTVGYRAYPINYEELYNLKGRLLTVIDATFSDPMQRKAQKNVVWQTLQAWMHDIERAAGEEPGPPTLHDEHSPA